MFVARRMLYSSSSAYLLKFESDSAELGGVAARTGAGGEGPFLPAMNARRVSNLREFCVALNSGCKLAGRIFLAMAFLSVRGMVAQSRWVRVVPVVFWTRPLFRSLYCVPLMATSYVLLARALTPTVAWMAPRMFSGFHFAFTRAMFKFRAISMSSFLVRRVAWRLLMRRMPFRPIFTTCFRPGWNSSLYPGMVTTSVLTFSPILKRFRTALGMLRPASV